MYEIFFSIKHRYILTVQASTPYRFKESSVRVHQIWVSLSKRGISAIVAQSSMRTVADKHRLDAYNNKHCWRAFRWYQHRWPWTTLNSQKYRVFFAIVSCNAYSKWEFSLKYTGDRPRQPAYEIKLMLSRVSRALAQISCCTLMSGNLGYVRAPYFYRTEPNRV